MKKLMKFLLVLILTFSFSINALAAEIFKIGDKNTKIAYAQKSLNQLGITVDRTDGFLDKKTSKAIKIFQKKYRKNKNFKHFKLKSNGRIDTQTLNALKEAVKQSNLESNKVLIRGNAAKILKTASKYKGTPYKYGGINQKGFDCSGYIYTVFKNNNINLPRMTSDQYKVGKSVNRKQLKPADLVFFQTYEKGASHVGIYAGNGKFWHASTSKGVMLSELNDAYWKTRYIGSKRVI